MPHLANLSQLLLASLDDVERVSALLNTVMQQAMHPVFELSLDGVIWYLNAQAAEAIGVTAQQAVGTRLTTYVTDGLMTQRHLETVCERHQTWSWPDTWNRDPHPVPCLLTGFAIPRTLSNERPRIILWADPTDADAGDRAPPRETLLPDNSRVLGKHLDPLRRKLNQGTNRICEMLGIATMTWYAWRRQPETPIPSRTVELHLRLLDAMPELVRSIAHPLDVQEMLRSQRGIEIRHTDLALLMGIERAAGYAWSHGRQANNQVQSLSETLLKMLAEKPRAAWDQYLDLVNRQARIENTDLWSKCSWMTPENDGVENPDRTKPVVSPASDAQPAEPVKRPRGRPRLDRKSL